MPHDRKVHAWQLYRRGWLRVPGTPETLVRVEATPQGFLWQCGKKYGFEDTLVAAKRIAEKSRECWPRYYVPKTPKHAAADVFLGRSHTQRLIEGASDAASFEVSGSLK